MTRYLATLLLLSAAPAYSDDYRQIVETALASVSQDYHHTWAFTESEFADDESTVGRYDPRNTEAARWTLLYVDDREPTATEIAEYQKEKGAELIEEEDDDGFDIVDLASIELLEETDTQWVFSFTPNVDTEEDKEGRKFLRSVIGRLTINRNDNHLIFLDLHIEKPVKPKFGVKISQFETRLAFGPAAPDGPIVPLSVNIVMNGRAMLAIKFDSVQHITLTDYEYVGP